MSLFVTYPYSGITGVFNQTADKILFHFCSTTRRTLSEQLGIYGACFKIAVIMVMFTQASALPRPFILQKTKVKTTEVLCGGNEIFYYFSLLIFPQVMFYLDILKFSLLGLLPLD